MIRTSRGEYDEKNALAGINPAIKLVCLIFLTASFIFAHSVLAHVLTAAFLAAVYYLAQVGLQSAKISVKNLLPLLLFVCVLDFCFASPTSAFYVLWLFTPSVNGAVKGLGTAAKVLEIALLFDLFRCLTEPMSLAAPLSLIFRPLSLLSISPGRAALTVASSFYFFDAFIANLNEISEMQKNKGLRIREKDRFDSAVKLRLLRPALFLALSEAKEQAALLEARGVTDNFGKISRMHIEPTVYDYCAMTVSVAFFAVQLIIL